jgi:RHS repeat-associated protein
VGTVQNTYVFFGGQRVARRDSAGLIHYYFSDHLGSHGVVENATGTACEQDIDYYPYGGVENDYCGTVPQNYKFTGKERDIESGLDYFEARHYAGTMARFMSVDPVIITPERKADPQQLNRYAYVRNSPLRLVDPTGEILQLSGDLAAGTADLCQIAGDDCNRISVSENGTVSFNTQGLDLSSNEGAALINQLVTSDDTYGYAVSTNENTAAGPQSMANRVESNLDNRPDDRYQTGKDASHLPPKGVADQVTINPHEHYKDSKGRSVSESSLAFHELAEAYAKIDGGKAYGDFSQINVVNGTTLQIGPPQQGAHNESVQREFKLREQRPNLQNSGRAGDQLIRDPHN